MSSVSLQHRVEYLGVRLLVAVVSRLPERVAWGIGGVLGRLAGSVLRVRRTVVDRNLERAFPDRSRRWRDQVARRTYLHFAREFLQIMRLERLESDKLGARIEVEGIEAIRVALAEGRGVIILTAHLGNWEIGAAGVTANGIELAAVAKRQANPLFDAYMCRMREHLGMSVVYQDEATRAVLRLLRRPQAVALVADQNAGRSGIFVDFFGVPASTARGPAVLAARTGAEVVFTAPTRIPGLKPRYSLRFVPVDWERAESADESARNLLQAFMELLEGAVRSSPEQYFWFHKRWKSRPPASEENGS